MKITENVGKQFVAIWSKIEFQSSICPYPRTSHTCTSYKNRYLVVIGGETEIENIGDIAPQLQKTLKEESKEPNEKLKAINGE